MQQKRRSTVMGIAGWLIIILLAVVLGAFARNVSAQPPDQRGDQSQIPSLDRPPQAKSEAEKRILAVIQEVNENEQYLSVPEADGRLLRILAESIGAQHVVELGTSTGYSGLWIGLALESTGGKLTTYEIDEQRAATARENFKSAGIDDRVKVIVGDAHEEVRKLDEPIDLLFLDADKEGYLDYLDKLLPLVRPGGLVVAHNMRRPAPDPRFVEAITTNPDLETIFLNMHAAGLSVSLKKRDLK